MKIPPTRRRRAVTADEHSLWRMAMRDTDPLPGHEIPVDKATPADAMMATPLPTGNLLSTGPAPTGGPKKKLPALDPMTPGVDRRTDERLRRGRVDIDGRIDLHGLNQAQAHTALAAFISRGWHEQRRCVLVITGKGSGDSGGGVLRQAVPRWLNEPPLRQMVIAIHRAQTRHGGDGALYVLIKRRRET
jgi:DNA-nicking Smr family endonuclease